MVRIILLIIIFHVILGKPAIAHRDLKSKNILVKSNHTCCIADLGKRNIYLTHLRHCFMVENLNLLSITMHVVPKKNYL